MRQYDYRRSMSTYNRQNWTSGMSSFVLFNLIQFSGTNGRPKLFIYIQLDGVLTVHLPVHTLCVHIYMYCKYRWFSPHTECTYKCTVKYPAPTNVHSVHVYITVSTESHSGMGLLLQHCKLQCNTSHPFLVNAIQRDVYLSVVIFNG